MYEILNSFRGNLILVNVWFCLQWKIRLRNQQYEREKEQQDHAIMLREIQKLLAEERNVKEGLQEQVSFHYLHGRHV